MDNVKTVRLVWYLTLLLENVLSQSSAVKTIRFTQLMEEIVRTVQNTQDLKKINQLAEMMTVLQGNLSSQLMENVNHAKKVSQVIHNRENV